MCVFFEHPIAHTLLLILIFEYDLHVPGNSSYPHCPHFFPSFCVSGEHHRSKHWNLGILSLDGMVCPALRGLWLFALRAGATVVDRVVWRHGGKSHGLCNAHLSPRCPRDQPGEKRQGYFFLGNEWYDVCMCAFPRCICLL